MIYPPDDLTLASALRTRLRPVYGYASSFNEMVKRTTSEAGKSQLRDVWNRTRFVASSPHEGTVNDLSYLEQFLEAARTSQFTFFDFKKRRRTAESLGLGNGGTTYTIPAKEIEQYAVYLNGVLQAGGSYAISAESGTQGEDRIIFGAGVSAANTITISFLGRYRYTVEMPSPPQVELIGHSTMRINVGIQEAF
jgi:hypothetical protein